MESCSLSLLAFDHQIKFRGKIYIVFSKRGRESWGDASFCIHDLFALCCLFCVPPQIRDNQNWLQMFTVSCCQNREVRSSFLLFVCTIEKRLAETSHENSLKCFSLRLFAKTSRFSQKAHLRFLLVCLQKLGAATSVHGKFLDAQDVLCMSRNYQTITAPKCFPTKRVGGVFVTLSV